MVSSQPIKIIILGAGTGGTALIDLFSRSSGVDILGVADINPNAPGLKKARQLGIPITHDVAGLLCQNGANLIVDVTGDPSLRSLINTRKAPGAEVLGGETAKLLWNLVQHEAEMQGRWVQTERLATIGTFSSGLAHDINNRLFLIMSLAENLLDGVNMDLGRDYAADILKAVRQIRSMVEGLSGYARGSSLNHPEEIDLTVTLEEALKLARYATVFHDVTVLKEYNARPIVKANSQEMLQVFVNLITNAIQAMDGQGTLRLTVDSQNGMATIRIIDTGPGIAHDLLDKIFEPFFSTKEPGKGTGLGLHVVRTLVEKHGGRISVFSRVGAGATFCLEFTSGLSQGITDHGEC
ncbi:MAG: ATP-binding protein [Nitrospira sp.]|nr:ATP-binding protein [Nitrospira sp.]